MKRESSNFLNFSHGHFRFVYSIEQHYFHKIGQRNISHQRDAVNAGILGRMYSEFSNIEYRNETFVSGIHDSLVAKSSQVCADRSSLNSDS